jgi:signal recognition particle subunit SRP19
MRKDNRIRVYPEYFDSALTRAEGRRVSKKTAFENPSLTEIKISAQRLQYEVEVDQTKAYSRQWDKPKGMLYINVKDSETGPVSKTVLLKSLSKTVKEFARPAILQKLKQERAKAELQASKKGKQIINQGLKPGDKKQAGKPIRRRR